MKNRLFVVVVFVLVVLSASTVLHAASIELNAVTFPERKTIKLEFSHTQRAPNADVSAKVVFREGHAEIEIDFEDMKPAVLFGGDVTCYVVWAVSRDGLHDNLGELWMPDNKGNLELSTGQKSFAILITAEPYALVDQPSELVLMSNRKVDPKKAPTDGFTFTDFAEAPDHNQESITNIAWDSTAPLDLMQAEKAYELAQRHEAEKYAEGMMKDAWIALGQAKNLAGKNKKRMDYSRRSIALSSDAIQITDRRKQAEELERQIAERRAEMDGLETRAQEAEQRSIAAREALEKANVAISEAREQQSASEAAVQRTQVELERIAQEKEAVNKEKKAMELEQVTLLSSLEGMREESARLLKEREELSNRLEGALSQVADTRDSARGLIVNLPDILFDLNKAALKADTKIVIAKMAGILLIMPELNVRVEGHTDATGGAEHNQKLSEQRAESVSAFLAAQGIADSRLQAVGYGEDKPVGDNDTNEGRKKNRRVEIIIAQGEITEEKAP